MYASWVERQSRAGEDRKESGNKKSSKGSGGVSVLQQLVHDVGCVLDWLSEGNGGGEGGLLLQSLVLVWNEIGGEEEGKEEEGGGDVSFASSVVG